MKICKYIIGLFAFVGLMTSCDKDNVGGIYTPYTQNISFESDEAVDILTSESSADFTIRLVRNITKGEYTVHYVFDTEDGDIFTDENGGTVTFADGQAVAVISMKASNMEKGVEYTGTLTLSDEDIETADTIIGNPIVITNITVMCDYDWEELGTGYYNSQFFEEGWDQPVYRAVGTNIYKLPDCLYKGYDIQFELSEDGNSLVNFEPQQSGYEDDTYGMVYFYAEEMEREGNTIKFPMYGLVEYNGRLATLYSDFTESITLPE